MMQLTHVAFGLLALSCLCSGTQLAAQTKTEPVANSQGPAAPQLSTEVRVGPGVLQGQILTATERKPVAEHSMTLMDASGKPLETVVTGADGVYHTRTLEPGAYSLMVRNDLQLDLVVAKDAATRQLDILMPQQPQSPPKTQISPRPQRLVPQDPAKIPAAPGGAAPVTQVPLAGLGTGTWALIGAGAAVAVAVPVIATQRGSSNAVSPVQPLNGRIRR
jgi:hypothetical protein